MSVADKMLKEIVTLAKKLATQEHENKQLWSSNMQLKQVCDSKAEQLRETEQELERLRKRHVEVQSEELTEARATIADLQKQLDAARAETVETRRRLNEETDRHRATNAEKIDVFQKLQWANQHNAELVEERDAARAAVTLQRSGIERLQAFVGQVREARDEHNGLDRDARLEAALAELDAEPTPVAEPARCPERELSEEMQDAVSPTWAPLVWDLRRRLREAQQARGHELERFDAFVSKVRELLAIPLAQISYDDMSVVRAELAALDDEPTPVAEPVDAEGGA